MDSLVKAGHNVLYLWEGEINPGMEESVNLLKVIEKVAVNVENVERIGLASYETGSFNVIMAKHVTPIPDLLALLLKVLKPQGKLVMSSKANDEVKGALMFAGFINVKSGVNEFVAEKPNYEVGSSAKLSFAKKTTESSRVAAVWKIDNDDDEIIDPDELLDEEDLAAPDPTTLKVCGTTGKRKACKDCSCGLAEELATENGTKVAAPIQKSSCGSCYLGDAFRCASCPYLGMPAFKPGEKIQLTENLLKADA